jgi:hypothetical protein
MKKKYITIAKSLGIILPVCLLASPVEAKAVDNVKDGLNNEIVVLNNSENQLNPIKDRIVQSFNEEPQTTLSQIDHTNIHANYKISHSNVHTNYRIDGNHTDQHSNTPSYHVNDHSNSAV